MPHQENFGGWCDTCFCFRDVRRAIVAIGMLTLLCATLEILVHVAVFTGYKGMHEDFKVEGDSKEMITYKLYIAFACGDFLLVLFSIMLLYGNERSDEVRSRKFLIPWLILVPMLIIYESAINIFYFYNQFNDKYDPDKDDGMMMSQSMMTNGPPPTQSADASPGSTMAPMSMGPGMTTMKMADVGPGLKNGDFSGYEIVPLVYWIVKDILYFISFLFIAMRVQSLTPIIEYVQDVREDDCGCNHSVPVVTRAAPVISLPAPVTFKTEGGCNCGACHRNHSQPVYGYRSNVSTGAPTGFSNSVYHYHR